MNSQQAEGRIGWILSIGLHGLLVLAFILTKLELQPFDLDFTPVTFAPIAEVEVGGGVTSPRWGGAQPMVDLPRRPMLNETSPLLKLPESSRQAVIAPSSSGKPDLSSVVSLRSGQRAPLTTLSSGIRERAPIKPMPLSDEALYGARTDALGDKIAGEEMFTIKWEGPARVKTSGTTPSFPEGVNKAVTVRLAFTVAPDGSVISVHPLTKGQAELEKVSIQALRAWRFNRLDKGLVQKEQDGVITFVFQLK